MEYSFSGTKPQDSKMHGATLALLFKHIENVCIVTDYNDLINARRVNGVNVLSLNEFEAYGGREIFFIIIYITKNPLNLGRIDGSFFIVDSSFKNIEALQGLPAETKLIRVLHGKQTAKDNAYFMKTVNSSSKMDTWMDSVLRSKEPVKIVDRDFVNSYAKAYSTAIGVNTNTVLKILKEGGINEDNWDSESITDKFRNVLFTSK